jgi:hypothetical protein
MNSRVICNDHYYSEVIHLKDISDRVRRRQPLVELISIWKDYRDVGGWSLKMIWRLRAIGARS